MPRLICCLLLTFLAGLSQAGAQEPDMFLDGQPEYSLDQRQWLFGNVDFLAIRPHFSEAVAFAAGQQTMTTFDVEGRQISFDYQAGFRTSLGMYLGSECESLSIGYMLLDGDSVASGTAAGPGQFIVDPFGNVVGSVTVVDPADARFGTTIVGGDFIRTATGVQLHAYDLNYSRIWRSDRGALQFDVGARIADVDQSYRSDITLGGAPISTGTFAVDFVGAGPRIGVVGERWFGPEGWFSVNASAHASWLVGDHDVRFTNSVALPFDASQQNDQERTVPVIEAEISADVAITPNVTLSAGWMFQSWYDLGASGGTFGGFFTGADDANVMSFDGFVARINWYW